MDNKITKICVAISTYNGSKYIEKQLESILEDYPDIKFFIRDDASKDNTSDILLNFFKNRFDSIVYLEFGTENIGVVKSYNKIFSSIIDFDYVFLSDQDDVWIPGRTKVYLDFLSRFDKNTIRSKPICIFSDLIIVDEKLNLINKSFWRYENNYPPNRNKLNRYLVQNPSPGCTMLINQKTLNFLKEIPAGAIMHDWWILLVAECFGITDYINKPTIFYRQHSNNTIGVNRIKGFNSLINLKFYLTKSKLNLCSTFIQANKFLQHFDNIPNDKKDIIVSFLKIQKYKFPKKQLMLFRNKFLKSSLIRNIITAVLI